MDNPFIIKSYETKELFCDREEELQQLLRNATGHTDTTLISQRRIGKTGLILRLFDELSSTHPDIQTIYMDIFASQSLDDFIKMMAEAAMRAFRPKSWFSSRRSVRRSHLIPLRASHSCRFPTRQPTKKSTPCAVCSSFWTAKTPPS